MGRRKSGDRITFDIRNSRDMLEKLRWECDQLRRTAADREALVHHALNAAWTAWHIHDWVWAAVSRDPVLRARFAKQAGIAPQKFDQEAFAGWLVKDKPDLDLCRIIATSAKHVGAEIGPVEIQTTVSVVTNVVGKIDDVQDFDALKDLDSLATDEWVPKLIIGDQRIRAVDVFERVIGYWTQLIYSNHIAGD